MRNDFILNATYTVFERSVNQYLEAIDGITDDDLNTWKPSAEQQGGGPMNTLSAMSVHMAHAAGWRIVHQVFGHDYPRDRESEFTATATRAEINELFTSVLTRFRELIDSGQEIDLNSMPATIRDDHPDRNRLDWLVSTIEHTALHLGHAQIHRQLWLAERASTP